MTFFARRAVLLCALLMLPVSAAAQIDADRRPPVRIDLELGLAVLDGVHTMNASPVFLTPGVHVRTPGRVFAFAGARALVFAIPVSGSGGEWVVDDDGRRGHRETGGLGGGPWVRAGVGVAMTGGPRAATVTIAGGSVGVGDPHPWVGASLGVPVYGRWRVEGELGYDRNWVEDRFMEADPLDPHAPQGPAYTRRTESWYPTIQMGLRWVR